jgi:hypothetical protein
MSDQSDQDPDADPADGDAGADASGVAVDGVTDADHVQGSVQIDGQEAPVHLSDDIVEAVEQRDDVDLEDVARAAAPSDGQTDFSLRAQTDAGDTLTIPVHDVHDLNLTRSGINGRNSFSLIGDDRIEKLEQNSVTYSEQVGDWILARDDLVPAIKERLKALLMGEDGLQVEPENPGSDADKKLADHLEDVYNGGVRPTQVVDTILDENMKNARVVLRATDLQPLDLGTLDYIRDGVTGEEIYWQSDTRVTTFDIPDDADADDIEDIDLDTREIDGQPLVIGDHVFDVSLYEKPPLEAVADTVVNKKQMQRLKARKAEIVSFGAIYAKVNPPDYLPEDEYFDRVEDGDGDQVTKLERALEQNLDAAFDWLKDYQSGTTGAIPMHWDLEQLQMPEGDEPLDDQIRGYNKDISRRLLVPIDLIELREGSELSRKTLMQTLLTTIQGWRQEILRVFEQFAQVQADVHDLNGSVEHQFPPMNDANVEAITSLLQYAGVLGATSDELRQMVNQIQGVELPTGDDVDGDGDSDLPPSGGPDDVDDRQDQMSTFLDDQNRRGSAPNDDQPGGQDGDQDGADRDDDPASAAVACGLQADAFTPPEGLDLYELDGWDQTSVWQAFISLGGTHTTCSKRMAAEVRNADAWCAALKDQALGTDLWRSGSGSAVQIDASAHYDVIEAQDFQIDYDGTLSDVADVVADVLSSNGADATRLMEQDDYVAFNLGDADPTDDEASGDFEPVAIVQDTDGFQVTGLSKSDDVLDGLDDALQNAQASLTAAHDFQAPSLREAAQKTRRAVEDQLPGGQTVSMKRRGSDRMAVIIHDGDGDIAGSLMVQESSVRPDQYLVTGTDRFFRHLSDFHDRDRRAEGGLLASIRSMLDL